MTNTRISKRTGRHLVLIDIENIAETPAPTKGQVEALMQALSELVPGFCNAQRVVACSHHAAVAVAFATPPRDRHLWRSGRNGADLALLDVLDTEHVAERFGHVTICSGDGIFAESVARLGGLGVDVKVVASRGRLAARLRLAARRVYYLPATATPFAAGSAS